jgi:uncharacterized protein
MSLNSALALEKLDKLWSLIRESTPMMVAYSGGVDSTFLLAEAKSAVGDQVLGVIADSPSLPRKALEEALANAREFRARVEVIQTGELTDPRYSSNPPNRCYFCKAELFRRMEMLAAERGFVSLAYGENADDALQLRPGSRAAQEFRVLAPLRTAGLNKAEIRWLSARRQLPTADAPAQPCLSSRIAHGTSVTVAALAMIENAEAFVRTLGFRVFRVRYRENPAGLPLARLEVSPNEMDHLPDHETAIRDRLKTIGFADCSIDLNGYGEVRSVQSSNVEVRMSK